MKNESGFKWKLGMFITIGFIILITALYFIGKERNLFGSTFRLKAIFNTVSGLKVGNNVRFSGINVGTVDGILIISDTTVLVEMLLQKNVQKFIKTDAAVSIGSEGLVGDRVVMITPGSIGSEVKENDYLYSQNPIEIDQILGSLKTTAENAEIITNEIAEIAYRINNGDGAISKLINDEEFAKDLTKTMNNLKESSKGLSENMEAAKKSVLLRGYYNKKKKEAEKKEQERKDAQKKIQEQRDSENKK